MVPPLIVTTRRIRRFAPLQLGKVLAILYGIMGLIFSAFFLAMSLFGSLLPAQQQRAGMLAFGVGFALFMPVMYAVMGFVTGVIGAGAYNLVARWVGGIEVDVETDDGSIR
jgi:hypothetical protein